MAQELNPWDARYGQDGFYYGTEPNDFLAELMMTREGLQIDFHALDTRVLEEKDRMIHEGKGHEGMSAVVRYGGVKQ